FESTRTPISASLGTASCSISSRLASRGGGLGGQMSAAVRDEHGDVQADQLLGERAHPLAVAIRPAGLNPDRSPLGETTLAQTGLECGGEMHQAGGGLTVEKADHRQRALLRARRERPRRRAAEQRDERAPFHCPMSPVLPT